MAGLVLLLGGVAMGQRPRLDPQGDYAYDLPSTEAAVRDVSLDDAGFAWSAEMPEGDTVFLEFRLAETTGEEPAVTAARGSASVRQVFEPKAAGRRFLDVSPLRAGDRVSLSGSGAKWQGGPARLFVYRNRPVAGRRVLVLAPHPDDAEIAAFGVYRQSNADIVTITAGDSGWQNFKALFPEEKEHYRIKGLLRAWDSITVPMIGGVPPERARNLGYYNGRMAEMQKSPAQVFPPFRTVLEDPAYYRKLNVDLSLRGRPFEGTWDALVGDIAWELGRVKPEVIVTPHPILDSHLEHQLTTVALAEALARWKGDCEIYLYTNHAILDEARPRGDRDAMTGLPAWQGADLRFSRVHSVPNTEEDRKLKLVALEAMHDLRAFDLRDGADPLDESKKRALFRNDYYRRAPRPVELFLVATREQVAALREDWLQTVQIARRPRSPAGSKNPAANHQQAERRGAGNQPDR